MEEEEESGSNIYYLEEAFLGGGRIPINGNQYRKLADALSTIISAIEVEELFQVFGQSFLRFEKDLLTLSLEFAYAASKKPDSADDFFSKARNQFNVNIITILTAYQSYADQSDRILKYARSIPGARELNTHVAQEVFGRHFSYRICDQLRNYAQHRALPLGGFSIGGDTELIHDNTGAVRKGYNGYSVSPWLDVEKLKSSKRVKAIIRDELTQLNYKKIDMKWLIRSFAGAMYSRHEKLRAFLKPHVEAAGKEISAGYDLASAQKGSEAMNLELHESNKARPMRNDLATKALREFGTYRALKNADRIYITSRIKADTGSYSGSVST